MTTLSGWCSQHGIPNHRGCRVPESCGCSCHSMAKQREIPAPVWENKARPQGALTPAASDHLPELAERG